MRIIRSRKELMGDPGKSGDRHRPRLPGGPAKGDASRAIIDPGKVEEEISRFRRARGLPRRTLGVKGHYEKNNLGDYGYLVDVHLLMLEDQMLVRETERTDPGKPSQRRLGPVAGDPEDQGSFLQSSGRVLPRIARTTSIISGERILRNLEGLRLKKLADMKSDVIIVAHDLSPMDTAQMDVRMIKGFVTDLGGRTSHTAILGRALGIPAVVGLERVTEAANGGDVIVIDGVSGRVVLNPSKEELAYFQDRQSRYRIIWRNSSPSP